MTQYERDRDAAQAVHDRLTAEWKSTVIQARAPLPPRPKQTLWARIRGRFARPAAKAGKRRTQGVAAK